MQGAGAGKSSPAGLLLGALAACLFASGLASLVLEVVWTRQLRLVFGSTTLAASTILVAYMLGLGLGGIVGGRLSSRIRDGVRAYGWMEVAIGLYALAVPAALARLPELNRGLLADLDFWPAALCRFLIALLVVILPTFFMGATLPVLVSAATRLDPRVGRHTSLLYGVNTLGAMAGVLLATFVLFERLGIAGASRVGALAGVGVGVVALLIVSPWAKRIAPAVQTTAAAPVRVSPSDADALRSPMPLLLAYGCVGFTALVYEVAWMRALAIVLGGSIHAFALMLGAFLTGIALGSLAARRWVERIRRPVALLATGIVLLGGFAFATTSMIPALPDLLLGFVERFGAGGRTTVAFQIVAATLLMLPATLVLGALMPLVSRIVAERWASAGDAVGRVYFANTIGSAGGAFLAGFVLIPTVGLRNTIALAASLNALAAALLLLLRARRASLPAFALGAAALVLPVLPIPFDRQALTRGVFRAPVDSLEFGIELEPVADVPSESLLYYRDGVSSTVSVHRNSGTTVLRVNGKPDASDGIDMPTQILLGQVPLLFGPPAKSVLLIGFASGTTAGSVASHPGVTRIDAVEIEPAMVEASRFFEESNGRPLDDPRLRVVLADGRAFLAGTHDRYDVIISEPSNPWLTGVSNLFTREFFQAARAALAPDGRLMQWVQLYGMDRRTLASILTAVRSEFEYVYGFVHAGDSSDLLLLAMQRPLAASDLPRWAELPESVRRDLARVGNFSDADLWSLLRLLPSDLDRLVHPGDPVNTDDNLVVELSTPWLVGGRSFDYRAEALGPGSVGALRVLENGGAPLDPEVVGRLAFSYAWLRRDPTVASWVIEVAERLGPRGTTIAAALAAARIMDPKLSATSQMTTLENALRRDQGSFEVWLLRAQVHRETDESLAGLDDVERALAIRPGDPRARVLRARLLRAAGKNDAALAEYAALVEDGLAGIDPEILQEQAELLLATGRAPEAVAVLRPLLYEGDSGWLEGWQLLLRAYREVGDLEAAQSTERIAEVVQRNRARRLHREARRATWKGATTEAIALLDLAIVLAPDDVGVRRERADLAGRPSPYAPPS